MRKVVVTPDEEVHEALLLGTMEVNLVLKRLHLGPLHTKSLKECEGVHGCDESGWEGVWFGWLVIDCWL